MPQVSEQRISILNIEDLTSERAENECYEIRTTPSKGYGCFALKDLKRGTRILADSPLLIVPIAHYLQSDVDKAFENLSSSEKDLYFSLASGHSQDPKNWPSKIHPTV